MIYYLLEATLNGYIRDFFAITVFALINAPLRLLNFETLKCCAY